MDKGKVGQEVDGDLVLSYRHLRDEAETVHLVGCSGKANNAGDTRSGQWKRGKGTESLRFAAQGSH